MTEHKLLGCPFCGNTPEWVGIANPDSQFRLKCNHCQFIICDDRKDKVLAIWNSRVEDKKENRPKVICFCGSLWFKELFEKYEYESVLAGNIALLPCCMFVDIQREYGADRPEYKLIADELHKRKIDLADEVFIINKDGYIGESTNSELHYAMKKGKKITFMETVSGSFSKSVEDNPVMGRNSCLLDYTFPGGKFYNENSK
jgi:hypothetical protein